MHAILIAIGSAGDVFPFIGLARTLKLRGHRVSLCTIPVFRDAVEQHGIAFVSRWFVVTLCSSECLLGDRNEPS